jgi:hypothetical protein
MARNDSFPRSKAYRDRATECRAIAESLHGAETAQALLKIAEEYDRMAMQAASLEIQQAELDELYSAGLTAIRPEDQSKT